MQKARRHPQKGAPTACRRTVSGSLSLPCPGCFSPFPHGTRPLSVSRECLALADGAAGFGQGSSVTRCGPPFQARSPTCSSSLTAALQPRARLDARGLGWPPFARRYSGGHSCFPFLRLLRCFSSAGSPRPKAGAAPSRGGLPHSETRGSKAARASPRNIVACHVLHRLREPQASPVRPLSLAAASGSAPTAPSRNRRRSLVVCLLATRLLSS